ncbi:MAG: class I SAM-dependent methyltransferase [Burkholderiales bacterium]
MSAQAAIKQEVLCPLSLSPEVVLLETVRSSDLNRLYQRTIGVDISGETAGFGEIGFYHCPASDLRFFHPMPAGSEKFYEDLQKIDWYYDNEKQEHGFASRWIAETSNVLEIGCGTGRFAQKITSPRYVGLELSRKAKEAAAVDGIPVLTESIEEHAAAHPGLYDVVCAFQVLEHIVGIRSFIRSSLECLKPGGLLIYSVPSAESYMTVARNVALNLPPHHASWWTDRCLRNIAELFGIQLVEIRHDRLPDTEKRWYSQVLILEALKSAVGYRCRSILIDRSPVHRLLSNTAALAARFLEKGFAQGNLLPYGYSETAIYRK